MTRQFTCEGCGGVLQATNTEAERDAESAALYAGTAAEEMAAVCSACWREVLRTIEGDRTRIEAPRAAKLIEEME